MKMLLGSDIGNNKTEIAIMEKGELKLINQPSIVSLLMRINSSSDLSVDYLVNNLMDNLIVDIFSQGLKHSGKYYVGRKALTSTGSKTNMDIHLNKKSEDDIPLITTLSMIAALGIQKEFNSTNTLPKKLSIDVQMATALPSSEYSNSKTSKRLHERFSYEHIINVYVGETVVQVTVNIKDLKVTEEGRTAMLAFLNSDSDILRHYNETYKEEKTPADFSDALALHADIGDGTSEFVFTEGFYPVPNSSEGLASGVGHVAELAINMYQEEISSGEISRHSFGLLLKENSDKGNTARDYMRQASNIEAVRIIKAIKSSHSKLTGSRANYYFIHGGGSIALYDQMYQELIELAQDTKGYVVWIPEEYAAHMNSKGCFYLAEALFANK